MKRIEVTTHQDKCRVFIEPDGSTSFELFKPLDPGVEWAIRHPRAAEAYCQEKAAEITLTWWQVLKQLWRDAW